MWRNSAHVGITVQLLKNLAARFLQTPYQSTESFSGATNVFSSGNTNLHFSEVWRNNIDQFISVICC